METVHMASRGNGNQMCWTDHTELQIKQKEWDVYQQII